MMGTRGIAVMLAALAWLTVGSAPAQESESAEGASGGGGDELMRPTEAGLRFTPGMARAMGKLFAKEALAREYDLDEAAQKKAADRIATRLMELAHQNEQQGQRFFEYAIESLIEHEGRFTPESGKRWAELSKPIVPAIREMMTNTAEDLRPLIPPGKQAKFAGDMLKMSLGFDAYEKKMERWSQGKAHERENPFDAREEMEAQKTGKERDPNEPPELADARRNAENSLQWETTGRWSQYLREAISYYGLDEAQKKSAESILKEMEQRADQVRNDEWKAKVVLNRTRLHLSWRGMNLWNTPWMWRLEREYEDLLAPIKDLTRELQDRLDSLPTEEQKRAAEAKIAERFAKYGLK